MVEVGQGTPTQGRGRLPGAVDIHPPPMVDIYLGQGHLQWCGKIPDPGWVLILHHGGGRPYPMVDLTPQVDIYNPGVLD